MRDLLLRNQVLAHFLGRPSRPPRVHACARHGSQAKLLEFMKTFQTERADEQFVEEKNFLITEISKICAPAEPEPPPDDWRPS